MYLQTNRLVDHLKQLHWMGPQGEESSVPKKPKRGLRISLPALCFTLAIGFSFLLGMQFPTRQNWEYTFVQMESPRHVLEMYELGEEGWQVAGFFQHWQGGQSVLLQRQQKRSIFKSTRPTP